MLETGRSLPGQRRVEHVMGMPVSVDIRDATVRAGALDAVFGWLRQVDEVFSTFKDTSEISRLGRGAIGLAECGADVRAVLELCERLREETGGYFDVRVGPAGRPDPSGLVKGWAVERASTLLVELGSANHCINAGGDVRLRGAPEPGEQWHVGIVHPFDRSALTAVVAGNDLAVATSGTAERGLHVVDPHTGLPVTDLASVTVVGPELAFADAYATAALAMGLRAPAWLATLPGREAYVIDSAGHGWASAGWGRLAISLIADPVPPA